MSRDTHELRNHLYFKDLSDEEWSDMKEHAYKVKKDMEKLESNNISPDDAVVITDQIMSLAEDLDILLDDFIDIRDTIRDIIDRLDLLLPKEN